MSRGSREDMVRRVKAWVCARFDSDGTPAHGWLHTARVRENAIVLALAEGVEPVLAELAALLHDVGRTQPGPESEHGARSAVLAEPLLAELPLTEGERNEILHAVHWHNSKRGDTQLLLVLRDADMIDGLGAIGLMRAFMSKGHLPAYDEKAPFEHHSYEWPASTASEQVLGMLRFYGFLNTDTARALAMERYTYMQGFISQVQREIGREF